VNSAAAAAVGIAGASERPVGSLVGQTLGLEDAPEAPTRKVITWPKPLVELRPGLIVTKRGSRTSVSSTCERKASQAEGSAENTAVALSDFAQETGDREDVGLKGFWQNLTWSNFSTSLSGCCSQKTKGLHFQAPASSGNADVLEGSPLRAATAQRAPNLLSSHQFRSARRTI